MRLSLPRFTIERLRTLVLVGGIALVAAIGIFLGLGQWKLHRLVRDLPKRLGVDIQQQADGVNYTQSHKGKTLFKIHAARAVQMKKAGRTLLHDVRIDLYGEDGTQADTISGSEFEYDPGAGTAEALGVVEITLMKPGMKPAIAQLAPGAKPRNATVKAPLAGSLAVPEGEIRVKTSGLRFDKNTGIATTSQRVDFVLQQGSGSSTGATFASSQGLLVLDHDVSLRVERGGSGNAAGPVMLNAAHAEFERGDQVCQMRQVHAVYAGGAIESASAVVHFRDDGSVMGMDGSGGVDLQTHAGSHLTAPRGTLQFDKDNHPQHGVLEGGVRLTSAGAASQGGRQMEGGAPRVVLAFNAAGQLKQAHLEQGVIFDMRQQGKPVHGKRVEVHRGWKSQSADVTFAAAARSAGDDRAARKPGQPGVEPRTIHGSGGVQIMSETTAAGAASPSELSADTVVAELTAGGVLSSLSGSGHTSFVQKTAAGVRQASASDELDVRFAPNSKGPAVKSGGGESAEIASVVQTGHVVLMQDAPSTREGGKGAGASVVRATADRSEYEGGREILQLTGSPRVRDGALDLTATQIELARTSGDAFAHGNVKASWASGGGKEAALPGSSLLGSGAGNGPVHVVAAEAEMRQKSEEVTFRGVSAAGTMAQPRMWQGSNSITAPVITLNRLKQTLVAQSAGGSGPVETVLVTSQSVGRAASQRAREKGSDGIKNGTAVIRMRSGNLTYSEGERLARFRGEKGNSVRAETTGPNGPATVTSEQAEVRLQPAGAHIPGRGGEGTGGTAVEQLTAQGHVVVDWPDRHGTGEKLVYRSEEGTFTLTGSGAAPPRIADQVRGTVTGSALIFRSSDDSVTVEGNGGKTVMETQSPK